MSRENIVRIKAVHQALEELATEVVFVGGATVALYADRPAAESRPTDDVDILVELMHYGDFAQLEARLRAKGFRNDTDSGVICRYTVQGVIVDVMPTAENILGFTNRWYTQGFATAMQHPLDEKVQIRIFQPAYFLAAKLEAFINRGGGHGRWSSDFEDIVYLCNNRTTLWQELRKADAEVQTYLKEQFRQLLQNNYLEEWVSVHLEQNEQRRVRMIVGEMNDFANE